MQRDKEAVAEMMRKKQQAGKPPLSRSVRRHRHCRCRAGSVSVESLTRRPPPPSRCEEGSRRHRRGQIKARLAWGLARPVRFLAGGPETTSQPAPWADPLDDESRPGKGAFSGVHAESHHHFLLPMKTKNTYSSLGMCRGRCFELSRKPTPSRFETVVCRLYAMPVYRCSVSGRQRPRRPQGR